ncbi:MAG: DUF559 domain-containing protein [Phycisphaerales bacterium]
MPRRNLDTEIARRFRRESSPPERILWRHLQARRLDGLKFRRQQPIGPFVADFYCAVAKLVIELDSDMHDRQRDDRRDAWMRTEGIETLRIHARDLRDNEEGVLRSIARRARERVEENQEKR